MATTKTPNLDMLEFLYSILTHLRVIRAALVHNGIITDDLYQQAFDRIRSELHPLNELIDLEETFRGSSGDDAKKNMITFPCCCGVSDSHPGSRSSFFTLKLRAHSGMSLSAYAAS